MPPTTIHTSPALDSFTSLTDHQSQTPTNFFGAKPVLHFHDLGAQALAPRDKTSKLAIFGAINASSTNGITGTEPSNDNTESQASVVEVVDIFVSSENLILFNSATSTGLSIPYPTISLHAIQRRPHPSNPSQEIQGLYMQLELEVETFEYDEEPESIELILLPAAGLTQALFDAVSNCSNLHPDPVSQDEDMDDIDNRIVFEGNVGYQGVSGLQGVARGMDNGGLPPPFPGSGGWITAENVGEYFDEYGNWIRGAEDGGSEGESLGGGAGRVRGRDEETLSELNGHGRTDDEDNKRPRME